MVRYYCSILVIKYKYNCADFTRDCWALALSRATRGLRSVGGSLDSFQLQYLAFLEHCRLAEEAVPTQKSAKETSSTLNLTHIISRCMRVLEWEEMYRSNGTTIRVC